MAHAEKKTSSWSPLSENERDVITVTAGLLAFTIAFIAKLIGGIPLMRYLSISTWTIFILAILLGLTAAALGSRYLSGKRKNANAIIVCANVAFVLSVLAVWLLVAIRLVQIA